MNIFCLLHRKGQGGVRKKPWNSKADGSKYMGTISFFIEFVFPFLAISSSPQYLCIDFSLCLFINVYKAFGEPREGKVSKYLVEEELKHWAAVFLLTLGSISSQAEPCSGDVLLLGWGWLKQAKS